MPESWQDPVGGTDPVDVVLTAIWLVLSLVEFLLVMPTVGMVRLAIHHSRSPGWCLRVMYTKVVYDGIGDYTVDFQTRKKRQAKRVSRAMRRELKRAGGNLDFNTPDVQAAVGANSATATVVRNTTQSGAG
jgi:hypothetical protein